MTTETLLHLHTERDQMIETFVTIHCEYQNSLAANDVAMAASYDML